MTSIDNGIAVLRSAASRLHDLHERILGWYQRHLPQSLLAAIAVAAKLVGSLAVRLYALYDRLSVRLKEFMPKGLYARALLIIIAPMVLLQSCLLYTSPSPRDS